MWAKNFAIALIGAIATFAFVIGACVGLIILGKIYGPGAILGTMVIGLMLSSCAALTYAYSKEKLEKMEREEERTLDALKTDFSVPQPSASYNDLMNQLNSISTKIRKKTF